MDVDDTLKRKRDEADLGGDKKVVIKSSSGVKHHVNSELLRIYYGSFKKNILYLMYINSFHLLCII